MKPLISVIIPVYNTEKYIERCVNSVLSQTMKKIEIILINDGSTDKSSEILNKYHIERKIKVISTKNNGVSAARNLGIKNSSGEFIYFLDSDDFIDKDALKKLYETLKIDKTSIAIGAFFVKSNEINMINIKKYKKITNSEEAIEKILRNELPRTACGILFRNSIVEKERIFFKDDLNYGEDFLFTLEYLSNCSLNSIVFDATYIVEVRNNSASRQNSINHLENVKKIKTALIELIKEKKLADINDALKYFIASEVLLSFEKILNSKETKSEKINALIKIKKYIKYTDINYYPYKFNSRQNKMIIKFLLIKILPVKFLLKTYTMTSNRRSKLDLFK